MRVKTDEYWESLIIDGVEVYAEDGAVFDVLASAHGPGGPRLSSTETGLGRLGGGWWPLDDQGPEGAPELRPEPARPPGEPSGPGGDSRAGGELATRRTHPRDTPIRGKRRGRCCLSVAGKSQQDPEHDQPQSQVCRVVQATGIHRIVTTIAHRSSNTSPIMARTPGTAKPTTMATRAAPTSSASPRLGEGSGPGGRRRWLLAIAGPSDGATSGQLAACVAGVEGRVSGHSLRVGSAQSSGGAAVLDGCGAASEP